MLLYLLEINLVLQEIRLTIRLQCLSSPIYFYNSNKTIKEKRKRNNLLLRPRDKGVSIAKKHKKIVLPFVLILINVLTISKF
jgi:hypothetical protein